MIRSTALFAIAFILLLTSSDTATAVIKKLTPLAEVLDTPVILLAEVDTVSPDKPAVTFKTVDALKGKSPTEKFIINLTGDNFAKKDKHTKVMLDRLVTGRKLLLFVAPVEDDFVVFGYMEGTWFQMRGSTTDKKTVWAFLHCEPYFRRTYKGTTEELRATIVDCLAGKKKPPAPDENEPHGYGPLPEKKEKGDIPKQSNGRQSPAGFVTGPLFGVIPSFVLVGPLAILSALFPTVFAGFASGLKRWRAFLMIASANSLLTGLYVLLGMYVKLPDNIAFGPLAITAYVVVIDLIGITWAGRRYRREAMLDPSITAVPARPEVMALSIFLIAVAGLMALISWWFGLSWVDLISMPTREFTAIGVGLVAAIGYAIYRIATKPVDAESPLPVRMSAPGEAVAIAGMLLFALVLFVNDLPRSGGSQQVKLEAGDAASSTAVSPKLTDASIWYEDPDTNQMFSGLGVTTDRVLFGCTGTSGVATRGYVICVDRATKQRLWKYTDKKLQTVYSTPTLVDGRVYFGEGLHTDSDCRILCLDANKNGEKLWEKATTSHTEGTPVLAGGKVYYSAGDDGIYCRDAATGEPEFWHFQGLEQKLHIDTPVVVADGKLYAGSGYNTTAVFCLDANTKQELWRKEVALRSFGPPLVLGKRIVYGLGTGNLTEDLSTEEEPGKPKESKPAGQILCLEADTGNPVWSLDLPKSVHTSLAADARAVYACCKDGMVYAIDRATGKKIWTIGLGSEFVGGPVVSTAARGAATVAVYAVTKNGNVFCIDPQTGKVFWSRTIQDAVGRKGEVMAAPFVSNIGTDGGVRELLVPATLTNPNNGQTRPAIVRFVDEIKE